MFHCVLAAMMMISLLSSAKSNVLGKCGPADRWVNSTCVPCPVCDEGRGLDGCGWGLGANAECQICLDGHTFSEKTPHSRVCSNCTSCIEELHRETSSECTIYENSKCGICLDEFYGVDPPGNAQVTTPPCYPCSKSTKGERTQCALYWERIEEEQNQEENKHDQKMHSIIAGSVVAGVVLVMLVIILLYIYRTTIITAYKRCSRPKSQPEGMGGSSAVGEQMKVAVIEDSVKA